MAIVRTVLSDIDPAALGRTDVHEHLLMRSPLLRGDELDDLDRSATEAGMLRAAGIDALVELTPIGLGRDPLGVAEIARRAGLQIVLATGVHRAAHYPPEHWVHRTAPEVLAELFIRDLAEGCDANDCSGPREVPTQVRAGVIKVGVGYWRISPTEHRVLQAAGQAHRRTGAAIVCHLELGTAGPDVLDALGAVGVAPDRIALAHADRNPDPGLHGELAAAGAYVCYDGAGRAKSWPDSLLVQCLYACGAVDPRPLVAAAAGVWGRPPPSLAVSGVQNGATPQRSISTRALTHDPDPTENIHTRTVAHPPEDRTAEVWLTTTPLPSAKSPDELRQQAWGRSPKTKGKELEEMRV